VGEEALVEKLGGGFGDLLKPAAFTGDLCFAPSDGRLVRFNFSAKVATAQTNVHKAQEKLDKARRAEDKKREDGEAEERSKREADEKRQHQEADGESRRAARERAAAERERQAADTERDQQVAALEIELAEARATLDSRPWENVPEKITVLFLTADPDGAQPLHIDREIRQIQEQVHSSPRRAPPKREAPRSDPSLTATSPRTSPAHEPESAQGARGTFDAGLGVQCEACLPDPPTCSREPRSLGPEVDAPPCA
jgi:hypothetical protein